ncbi:MAG: hypothetical protein AAGD92_02160 [Pseudomonadota bacterium]
MVDDSPSPPSLEDIDRAPLEPAKKQLPSLEEYDAIWSRFHEVANRNFELEEKISKLKREQRTADIFNDLAKPAATNAFRFMCAYAAIVGVIVLMDGANAFGFDLEPDLMQILVGSTAITVIGLFASVLTGIFISRPK